MGVRDPAHPGRGEGWGRLGIAEAQLVSPLTGEAGEGGWLDHSLTPSSKQRLLKEKKQASPGLLQWPPLGPLPGLHLARLTAGAPRTGLLLIFHPRRPERAWLSCNSMPGRRLPNDMAFCTWRWNSGLGGGRDG